MPKIDYIWIENRLMFDSSQIIEGFREVAKSEESSICEKVVCAELLKMFTELVSRAVSQKK